MKKLTNSQNSLTGSESRVDDTFRCLKVHIFMRVPFLAVSLKQRRCFLSIGLTQFSVFHSLLHEPQGNSAAVKEKKRNSVHDCD